MSNVSLERDHSTTPERKTHIKARTQIPAVYPPRFPVDASATWHNTDRNEYTPSYFVTGKVLARDTTLDPTNPLMYADPEDVSRVDFTTRLSYEGPILFDETGLPLNPIGPTGIRGRGLLGKWGPNHAADPIVTRINDENKLEMIAVKRIDSGEWAIPGGMVDKGERVTQTLQRELSEESSANLSFEKAVPVYQGYVDDPRNTDNAWIETDAYHLHIPSDVLIQLAVHEDATEETEWMELREENIDKLYASHADLVKKAISMWEKENHAYVASTGEVNK